MHNLTAYIPMDRRQALARGETLPDRCTGAALFADVSGFTPLTRAFAEELGSKRGAEAMLGVLNPLFEALIAPVHRYGGSVIGFVGDAITCWFDEKVGCRASRGRQQTVDRGDTARSTAARATMCALAMQEVVRPLATVQTPGGQTLPLHTKVAIAYGPARRFVVGDPTIQYLDTLAGTTLARMAEAEHHAEANEVVVSREVVAQLGDLIDVSKWRNEEQCAVVAGLKQPVIPAPWPTLAADALAENVTRPWVLPDVYTQLHRPLTLSSEGELLGDLRPATPLMLRFGGLDFDGNEAAGETLDVFVRWVQQTVYEHGGNLLQLTIGDKGAFMYSVFGAPVTHEDDALRALHTALALRDLPPALSRSITPMQIGLTRGEAWTGLCGAPARHKYNVVSSEVNLAARLMAAAQPGQILVSESMRNQPGVTSRFDLDYVSTQVYKGFSMPIPTYMLRREHPKQRMFSDVMVGREAVLQQLLEFTQPIFSGRCAGIAFIYGEAGIGKSRLAYALRRRLAPPRGETRGEGVTWFTGQTDQLLRQPFNPFVHWLKRYFDQLPGASQEENRARFEQRFKRLLADLEHLDIQSPRDTRQHLASALARARSFLGALLDLHWPDTLYEKLGPSLRHTNTMDAVKTLLLVESCWRPVVFELEDAHWMDEASYELLSVLSQDIMDYPLFIVVTSRYTEDGAKPTFALAPAIPTLDVELHPLSSSALRQQMENILEGPVDHALYTLVLEKAEANPFFTQQILYFLREQDQLLQTSGGIWTVKATDFEIPTSISAILIARLDRLTRELKRVVHAAAVMGREFETHILSYVLRHDVLPEVTEGEARQIWVALSAWRYMFNHAMLRDAAHQMQLRARLRDLHRLVAEAIETLHAEELDAYYADLAYHYGQAEVATKEAHYATLAGKRALATSHNRQALAFFKRSLALLPEDDAATATQRMQVLQWAGDAQARLSDYSQALAYGKHSLELARQLQDNAGEAGALLCVSRVLSQQGQYEEAQRHNERSLALQRALDNPRGVVDALAHLSWIMAHQGHYASAMQHAQEGLAISQAIGYYQGIVACLSGLKWFTRVLGDYATAQRYAAMSLKICREIGNRWEEAAALTALGAMAVVQGDYAEARPHFEASLKLRRAMGDRRGMANTLNALGAALIMQDAYELARQGYQEALTIFRDIHDRQGAAYALGNLSLTAALQGNLEQAIAYAEESLAIFWDIGDRRGASGGLCYLALVQIQRQTFDAARDELYESLQIAQKVASQVNVIWSLVGYAWLYLAMGRLEHSAVLIGLLETCPAPDTTALYIRKIHAKLAHVLKPDVLRAALARGAARDLDDVAAEILQKEVAASS